MKVLAVPENHQRDSIVMHGQDATYVTVVLPPRSSHPPVDEAETPARCVDARPNQQDSYRWLDAMSIPTAVWVLSVQPIGE